MQQKPGSPPVQATAAPPKMEFPHELRRHFYQSADWTTIIFISVSLSIHVLAVGIVASRDWKDPVADLTNQQLLQLQERIVKQYTVNLPEAPAPTEELPMTDVTNPEFDRMLQQTQANLEASLQSTLAAAQSALAAMNVPSTATGSVDVQAELGALLGSMGDIGSLGDMSAAGGPSLDIAPTDVAIFAKGATGSRVVAQAIDIGALGSDVQVSSQFTRGGVSAGQAARLTQQIRLARERLGGDIQIRVASGLGGTQRAVLHIAGGKTGQRINVQQLALPPARAAGPSGRDQESVEAQAARTRSLIGGCYTIGLASDPSLSGVVVVRFTITPNGVVSDVRISKSNIGNRDVEECVVAAVQTWKFGAAGSTDTFEYPFAFEPG